MALAKDYLDYELVDDSTPYGGKSFSNETLKDFLDSVDMPYDTNMRKVNKELRECGIEPIPYKECKETYYQPFLYKDDGTNIEYNMPEGLFSFQVFHTKENAEDWLKDNGYAPEDFAIVKYHDEDIEEHTYIEVS